MRVPFFLLFGLNKGAQTEKGQKGTTGEPIAKGPSTQIVGFQGPKTTQSMDFGTKNLTIWVLRPSGVGYVLGCGYKSHADIQEQEDS